MLALWAPANLGYKSGFLWGGGPLEAGPWEEEEGGPWNPTHSPGAEGTFFVRSGLKMLNFTKFCLKARGILQRSFYPEKLRCSPLLPCPLTPRALCCGIICRKLCSPGFWLWGWRRANARGKMILDEGARGVQCLFSAECSTSERLKNKRVFMHSLFLVSVWGSLGVLIRPCSSQLTKCNPEMS